MILPKKWAHGQLFAFSALDGQSLASRDFTGMLSGDRIAIRFYSKVKRELMIANVQGRFLEYDAVCSDYISFHFPQQESVRLIYAREHLVIGNVAGDMLPLVFTEGLCKTETEGNLEIHDSLNGEFTALIREGKRFAFAYGYSREEAIALAREGLALDLDEEEKKKQAFFEKLSPRADFPYAALYVKCLSVMKTQLYSPESVFKTIWSTPDRLPHHHMWLWDSVYHALGHRHIDGKIAEDLIRAIFSCQHENGFIPHMMDVDQSSDMTQPPIIGWGAWEIYQTTGSKEFLQEVYAKNKPFLAWCQKNRRLSDKELYTWNTGSDVNCRCDESGMDNSSRFDIAKPLFAIDFSCFMANDVKYMKKIAEELGMQEDAAFFGAWFDMLKKDINEMLWSEEDGFYFDYNIGEKKLHKVWAVSSFLPLFAEICDEKRAQCLVDQLKNPETFATPFPIPTVALTDATFGSDMWRGPVWINYNYMIAQGLRDNGYGELAREIVEKTVAFQNEYYQKNGLIYEFYDSQNRKAPSQLNRKGPPFEPYNINIRLQTIRDYGWSTTLLLDMLHALM